MRGKQGHISGQSVGDGRPIRPVPVREGGTVGINLSLSRHGIALHVVTYRGTHDSLSRIDFVSTTDVYPDSAVSRTNIRTDWPTNCTDPHNDTSLGTQPDSHHGQFIIPREIT